MQLTSRYQKIFQSILSILSLLSSGLLFYILGLEIINDRKYHYDHEPYLLLIVFAGIFLISAVNYWLLDRKYIKEVQNGFLVVQLGLLLASALSGEPADWTEVPFGLGELIIVCLSLTVVAGFIYTHLQELSSIQRAILLLLKLLSSLIALGFAFFLFLLVSIGGNTFLMMPQTEENWALTGILVLMILNVAEGIFIWFKVFRSWWAWLLSVLVMLEIAVPLVYDFINEKSWIDLLFGLIIAVVVLGMTYLNNRQASEN